MRFAGLAYASVDGVASTTVPRPENFEAKVPMGVAGMTRLHGFDYDDRTPNCKIASARDAFSRHASAVRTRFTASPPATPRPAVAEVPATPPKAYD